MIDAALVYTVGVLVLFFFWVYGIVAFVRDVKNYLIPAYRQYRAGDEEPEPSDAGGGAESRYPPGN